MKSWTSDEIRRMMYGIDGVVNLDNAATTQPFARVVEEILGKLHHYNSIGRGLGHRSVSSTSIYVNACSK